ncbi:MAG: sodium/proline symporter [Pseudomonadota bacterium]
MSRDAIVLTTLAAYKIALLLIGVWASRRNSSTHDYLLAGGGLGGWVAGLSASASSSSAWTLLGVSGAAFAWGWSAIWLLPATLGGFFVNWLFVAPRLAKLARAEGALTLSEVVMPASLGSARAPLLRLAAAIIVFCFVFYIAAQFDGAGKAFTANFGWSSTNSILIGAVIIIAYTWLGGFWAVSVTDALQALMMLLVAIGLPLLAVSAAWAEPGALSALRNTNVGDTYPGVLGVAFVIGTLGIGLGYPGQPHVVNRFMALKDEQALRRGRLIALLWAVLVYVGMLSLGWSARVLIGTPGAGEQALFLTADALLPPLAAGLVLAAVLSAIMSTADSQLLSAAAAVAHDWRLDTSRSDDSPMRIRVVVLLIALTAVGLALFVPQDIFSRVLFAWHAIGAALGPLLIARLVGWQLGPKVTLAAMLSGFVLTVLFHLAVDSTGDWVERLVPFIVGGLCIAIGGQGESNASR